LELLSSQRFKSLLRQLQEEYEVIVIDSAPALAVSDALVVAQLADALLYVVRADATPYQAAEQGLKRLRRVNAPMLGVVLNQVTSSGRGYYGRYGRYQRYFAYSHYDEYYGVEV
jgi:Mrp family chromosome partitioning ATPase